MNWIKNMNDALKFIEDNLDKKITLDDIAKVAFRSKFDFAKTFVILTGMNLSDYIRGRRLTVAVKDLKQSEKVMNVAFKYCYESPESFSKAFKKLHGISPSKVKHYEGKINAVIPLSISVVLKGEEKINYRIIKKESFDIVGLSKEVTTKDGENFKIVPMFWQETLLSDEYKVLCKNAGPFGVMGVCNDFDESAEKFDYLIAVEGSNIKELDNLVTIKVQAQEWAVFECLGALPDSLQKTILKIYSEWLPATHYEHAGTQELEVYLPGDTSSPNYKCELWIPIKEK